MPIPTVNGPELSTRRASWGDALRLYWHPRVLSMLFLGFSAGLPFFLVFSTLSAWLRQAGVERSTIGMLSWVGILYSIKFVWAPVVDRVRPPFLHRFLGRRRGWMLLAQLGIAVGLFKLSLSDPAARRIVRGPRRSVRGVLRGYPGHCSRCLAHRVRIGGDAGCDAGRLPGWLSDRAHSRQRRGAHYRGLRRLAHQLRGDGRTWWRWHHHDAARPGAAAWSSAGVRGSRGASCHVARAPGSLAAAVAGRRRVVHGRGGVSSVGFFWALRPVAGRPGSVVRRELPADRVHDGLDGESLLHRPRLHPDQYRQDRKGLRLDDVDPGRVSGRLAHPEDRVGARSCWAMCC